MQVSVTVFEVEKERTKWKEFSQNVDIRRLVFLDESGVNTNMKRRYGRSIGKTRAEGHAPLNKPKSTTI